MWYINTEVKNNDILKFAGKWMELEKNRPDWGDSDPERQTWYVLTHKWILDIKQKITILQFINSEKLGSKDDTNKYMNVSPRKEKKKRSPE